MNPEYWKIPVLAVIQGVTEFLPISSSGHIVIFQHLFGLDDPGHNLMVNVVLHAGTLLAILIYYGRDLWQAVTSKDTHLLSMIAIGTAPVLVVGLALKAIDIEDQIGTLEIAMVAYLFCAAILLILHRRDDQPRTIDQITWLDALKIGCMQCIAVLPGISRSGSTIATATRLGLNQVDAARFSFYIGIAPIAGANIVLGVLKLVRPSTSDATVTATHPPLALLLGFIISAVVGYAALVWLIKLLQGGKFHRFGYYCLSLSILLLIYRISSHTP